MERHDSYSGIPEPIATIYWQAYVAFDKTDDPRLKRALVGVMDAVHKEFLQDLGSTILSNRLEEMM